MTDNSTRWLVITAGTRERREIDAYLYAHTMIITTLGDGFGAVHIAVVADPRITPAADFLARYQADRLASGMIRAQVTETFSEACRAATAELDRLAEFAS